MCACVCARVCCVCAVRDVGKLEMEVRVCAPPSSDTRGEFVVGSWQALEGFFLLMSMTGSQSS